MIGGDPLGYKIDRFQHSLQSATRAQRELAASEGLFVEPGSAASVAGLLKDVEAGADFRGRTMVLTVTGHGLKDIDTAMSTFGDVVDVVVDVPTFARSFALKLSAISPRALPTGSTKSIRRSMKLTEAPSCLPRNVFAAVSAPLARRAEELAALARGVQRDADRPDCS